MSIESRLTYLEGRVDDIAKQIKSIDDRLAAIARSQATVADLTDTRDELARDQLALRRRIATLKGES